VSHISLVFGEMWEMNLLSRVDPPGLFIRTEVEGPAVSPAVIERTTC
jgi:hypothetical protein